VIAIGKRVIDAIVAIAGKLGATVTKPTGNKVADYLEAIADKAGSGLPEVSGDDDGKVLKVSSGTWGVGEDSGLPDIEGGDWCEGLSLTEEEDGNGDTVKRWYKRRYPLFLGECYGPDKEDYDDDAVAIRYVKNYTTEFDVVYGQRGGYSTAQRIACRVLPCEGDGTGNTADTRGKTMKGDDSTGAWGLVDFPEGLPAVTTDNNGKIMKVVSGVWALADESGLPAVTTSDKKKGLAVNATSGQWEVSNRVVVVENGDADLTNGSCRSSYAPVWDSGTSQWKRMKVTWLPATGSENKGKTIRGKNSNGEFELVDFPTGLPAVTADDNGKILKVVDGAWAVVSA